MKDGFLYFSFNLGMQDIIGRSLTKFSLNQWYHIHVTRMGKRSFLIIKDQTGQICHNVDFCEIARSCFVVGYNSLAFYKSVV